jgi:hypothetical protein
MGSQANLPQKDALKSETTESTSEQALSRPFLRPRFDVDSVPLTPHNRTSRRNV